MKKVFYVAILVVAVLALIGCSGDLSKSKAKSLLKANPAVMDALIKKKVDIRIAYPVSKTGRDREQVLNDKEKQRLETLQEKGFISIATDTRKLPDGGTEYSYDVTTTAKMKPFILQETAGWIKVKIANLVVDEVKGIAKTSDNGCYARIRVKIEPTPVGKLFSPDSQLVRRYQTGAIGAVFQRDDKGWRFAGYQSFD